MKNYPNWYIEDGFKGKLEGFRFNLFTSLQLLIQLIFVENHFVW